MKQPLKTLLNKNNHVLCGEGYLFELERRGYISMGPLVPMVVLEHPEAVKQLHREYARCGSNIIEAFTYYGHREKLKLIGKEDQLEQLNRQAIRIAKEVSKEFPGTLVAGNVSNSNIWNPDDELAKNQVKNNLKEQIQWAKEEGADFIIGETFGFLDEAIVALELIKEFELESVITLSINGSGKVFEGISAKKACEILAKKGATVVGFNCARGPESMLKIIKECQNCVNIPMAALPVIYNTTKEKPTMQKLSDVNKFYMDLEPYLCTRFQIEEFAREASKLGIKYLGVCCGASPYHLRALAKGLNIDCPSRKYDHDLSKHYALNDKSDIHEKQLFN